MGIKPSYGFNRKIFCGDFIPSFYDTWLLRYNSWSEEIWSFKKTLFGIKQLLPTLLMAKICGLLPQQIYLMMALFAYLKEINFNINLKLGN